MPSFAKASYMSVHFTTRSPDRFMLVRRCGLNASFDDFGSTTQRPIRRDDAPEDATRTRPGQASLASARRTPRTRAREPPEDATRAPPRATKPSSSSSRRRPRSSFII